MGWMKVVLCLLMLSIFLQDLRYRAVHWWLFPLLLLCGILAKGTIISLWMPDFFYNLGFCVLQLLLLTLYLSARQGRFVLIFREHLGIGDLLFLVAVGAYLSFLNFLLFYVLSLVLIALFELVKGYWAETDKKIPLAGYQGLLLVTAIAANEWFVFGISLTDDAWLLNYVL